MRKKISDLLIGIIILWIAVTLTYGMYSAMNSFYWAGPVLLIVMLCGFIGVCLRTKPESFSQENELKKTYKITGLEFCFDCPWHDPDHKGFCFFSSCKFSLIKM